LLGSVLWAAEIILVSSYSRSSMTELLFGAFVAGAVYGVPLINRGVEMDLETLTYMIYLALACSILATFLQVYGQRYISEKTAAIIFLLEPVFATIFSMTAGLETVDLHKMVGGGLITASLYFSASSEFRRR